MFTGLVTDVGTVRKAEHRNGLTRFEVESGYPLAEIAMGASIMNSGVCLTVVAADAGTMHADIGPETARVTTLGCLAPGQLVNLERAMRVRIKPRHIPVLGSFDAQSFGEDHIA